LRNNGGVLKRLKQIVTQKENATLKKEASEDSFKEPNWTYHQAYLMGQRSVYNDLKKLLEFLE
jgi:hypothetical protein